MRIASLVRPQFTKVCAAVVAALALASCGGGDPYAGLWSGSMDSSREVNAIVLGDGSYYMLYSRPGLPTEVAGLVAGVADFHGARLASDAVDYNWERMFTPARPVALSAQISPRMSVDGSIEGSRNFHLRFDKDLDGDARLADLVGAFDGNAMFALGTRPGTFTVTASGQVSTNINGCPITGQVAPRSDANAFDLTLTFGGYPCVFPGAVFQGVAVYRDDQRRLDAAVINAPFKQAIAFIGTKR